MWWREPQRRTEWSGREHNGTILALSWSGVVYVAFVIDVFSRRLVGWKASTSMLAAFVVGGLSMAA